MSFTLKKFESQNEVDEKKRKRQEEWDKVRKPEDPIEAPEAPVDNRSLYDRLEEQKVKKQEEIDEQFALKNQVKGLDEDESKFLDFVADRQMDILKSRKQEESDILSEMKDAQVNQVIDKTGKQEDKKMKQTQPSTTNKRSQMALLAKAVKRKGSEDTSAAKKSKCDTVAVEKSEINSSKSTEDSQTNDDSKPSAVTTSSVPVAQVVAIRPSAFQYMQDYEDSSDSMSSSSDSEPDFSLSARSSVVAAVKQHLAQQQQQH